LSLLCIFLLELLFLALFIPGFNMRPLSWSCPNTGWAVSKDTLWSDCDHFLLTTSGGSRWRILCGYPWSGYLKMVIKDRMASTRKSRGVNPRCPG
jgi:hypothetical protein